MRVPDYAHYITAYRFWIVSLAGYLYPISQRNFLWPAGRPAIAHLSPHGIDSVGLWACKPSSSEFNVSISRACLLPQSMPGLEIPGMVPPDGQVSGRIYYSQHVVGEVALWGDITEHRYGYRAQYAYPLNLHGIFNGWSLRALVEAQYGVPVVDHPSAEAVAKVFELELGP